MADPSLYKYPSPLSAWENLPPLPERSSAYETFPPPITNDDRGGFDVHIYFQHRNDEEVKFAKDLWERIRREFPEPRIYQVWEYPIGPHPLGMFEVNLFTPEQFGAFVSWLVINRGPLSALVHPNTGDDERDHTQRATWLGQPYPLNLKLFKKMKKS
ncbi:hypothetical protein K402DRAFT_413882 [Aulographum hederae CBS 113979]|uniref:Dopa 4,5-dioxygenase n=1 Tax=Aulographum hederae CBS 113979 TaxID=1176131 RepID=A0A6G1GU82_9PEZI|nr:hypothetical protein K402DRAFT_413882 [Aulographum hederae CBS 113979]